MKVAIQVSGLLRYSDQSLESLIKNVIQPLNADVFASFWVCDPDLANHWQIQVGPRLIEFEHWELIKPAFDPLLKYPLYPNLIPMMWKFYQVNQLKQAWESTMGTTYDAIIQLRSDGVFFESFPVDQLQTAVEQNTIKTTLRYSPNIDPYITPRMADTIFCGPNHLINQVSGFIWALADQLEQNDMESKPYYSQVPEILQSQIWNKHAIPLSKLTGNGPENNYNWDLDPGRK